MFLTILISCVTLSQDLDNDLDGFSINQGDCNDNNAELNPADADADGQSTCEGDCDDFDPFVYTGNAYLEDPDGCFKDADGDGWGDNSPQFGIAIGQDCNDEDAEITPADEDGDGHHVGACVRGVCGKQQRRARQQQ